MKMNEPKLLLIFNEKDAERMTKGEIGVWCGHASMMFHDSVDVLINWGFLPNIKYGDTNINRKDIETSGDHPKSWFVWYITDYRKIVLTTKKTIREEYEKAVGKGFLSYLQKSARDGKDKCLAVFGTDKELKEFTKKMRLMK